MGAKVSGFVKDVAKAASKGATSFVLGKIPIVGGMLADKINSLYKAGGKVVALADGGVVSNKPKMVINTPQQLLSLVNKVPEIAEKHGLTPEIIKEGIAKAKEGEAVVAKRRGGKMKKHLKTAKKDKVVLQDEEHLQMRRGGLVPSVF